MELKSDIICKGKAWYKVGQGYGYREKPKYFSTFWASFKLCMAIGILYDCQLEDEKEYDEDEKMNLPRTMFNRYDDEIRFFFQTAILTSNCIDLSEKDRLYLAFSEEISESEMETGDYEILVKGVSEEAINFDRVMFLKKFANYGAERMAGLLSNIDSETMENIADFLTMSYNGETEELIAMRKLKEISEEELLEEELPEELKNWYNL